MEKVAVVYLARGKDTPWTAYENFFSSYQAFPAGLSHDLVILLKGWTCEKQLNKFKHLGSTVAAKFIELPDDGFDWGAYFRAANVLEYDYLSFFNTYCEFLHAEWLRIMHKGFEFNATGAVGCTGSWESMLPSFNFMMGYFLQYAYSIKDLARWLKNHMFFPRYPNPHMRSNAFIIRRKTMLAFASECRIPANKEQAYALESGFAGLTRFLCKKGLPPLVAGADEKYYSWNDWDKNRIFRQNDCSNLLVADNQTRDFAMRSEAEKAIFMASTWKRELTTRFSLYPLFKQWISSLPNHILNAFRE
jgi:hypothetical protein